MGNYDGVAVDLHRSQDQQAESKGGEERPKDDLTPRTTHEVLEQSWPILRGGQRQGHQGHGKRDAGRRDHGADDGREEYTGAFTAPGIDPSQAVVIMPRQRLIQFQGYLR